MARKRRNQAEMCEAKKKERSKYYARRSKALKQLTNPKIQGKKRDKAERDRKRADNKINQINHYLFKCTKKYDNLRKQKRRIQFRKSKMRNQLRDMGQTEKGRMLLKIRDLVIKENNLDKLMGKGVFLERGKVKFESDADRGAVEQVVPAWLLGAEVNDKLLSGKFDVITINGIDYHIADTGVLVIMSMVSDIVVDIVSKQNETRTPMALFGFNEDSRSFYIGTSQW